MSDPKSTARSDDACCPPSLSTPSSKGGGEKYLVTTSVLGALATAGLAALTSLCCVGPAVLAVLGVGGAVAAAGLAPYRPYFLAASFVLLGFGFWRSYRARARGVCSIATGRTARVVLWGALGASVVAAILPFVLE